jgi:hypothetical protein
MNGRSAGGGGSRLNSGRKSSQRKGASAKKVMWVSGWLKGAPGMCKDLEAGYTPDVFWRIIKG